MAYSYSDLSAHQYHQLLTPLNPTAKDSIVHFFRKLWHALNNNFEWVNNNFLADKFISHLKAPNVSPIDIRTCYVYHLFKTRAPETKQKLAEFDQQLTLASPYTNSLWKQAFTLSRKPEENEKVLEENRDKLSEEETTKLRKGLNGFGSGMYMTHLDAVNRKNMRCLVNNIALGITYPNKTELSYALNLYQKFLEDRAWDLEDADLNDIYFDLLGSDPLLLNAPPTVENRPRVKYENIHIEEGILYASEDTGAYWLPGIFITNKEETISYVFDGTAYQSVNHATNEKTSITGEELLEQMKKFGFDHKKDEYLPVSKSINLDKALPNIHNWYSDASISHKVMAALYKLSLKHALIPYVGSNLTS